MLYADGPVSLFCFFENSSQNQRFPNDCINSKQTNQPKTTGHLQHQPYLRRQPWWLWRRVNPIWLLPPDSGWLSPWQGGFSQPSSFHPILCSLVVGALRFLGFFFGGGVFYKAKGMHFHWQVRRLIGESGGLWTPQIGCEAEDFGAWLAALLGALTLWELGDID